MFSVGFDLVIARTGYTGEEMGFELFVHPDRAVAFWEALLEAGKPSGFNRPDWPRGQHAHGGRPAALRPRVGGTLQHLTRSARFAGYVKLHKPYFIGQSAYMRTEQTRTMEVTRFRMNDRGVRMPKTGDPVVHRGPDHRLCH